MSWLKGLARPDILSLRPFEHAVWQPELTRMHANESPWRASGDYSHAGLNRYPEPQPRALIERLATLYSVSPDHLLVGRGSDEAIDLLVRAFCRAGQDAVLICPPTFGMYSAAAGIQGARVVSVPLTAETFALDEAAVLDRCAPEVKLVFLCSPNNPTGNLLDSAAILRITAALAGRTLVVVDEAYIEYCDQPSFARHRPHLENLAILRTLSKAHALAGARCGALIADKAVIDLLWKIIHPYAVAQPTVEAVMRLLEPESLEAMRERTVITRGERERLWNALAGLKSLKRLWPSETNFILAEFENASEVLARARSGQLLIRDAYAQSGLKDAVRITVGTPLQNERLIRALS